MSSVTEAITVALGKQGGMLFGPRRCLLRVRSHGVAPELWIENRDRGRRSSVGESATGEQQRSFQLSAVMGQKGLWAETVSDCDRRDFSAAGLRQPQMPSNL